MMGNEKLSTIREKLRAAFLREGGNPIASLDRRIQRLTKKAGPSAGELSLLRSLRSALAQVVGDKPRKRVRTARAKPTKKAM